MFPHTYSSLCDTNEPMTPLSLSSDNATPVALLGSGLQPSARILAEPCGPQSSRGHHLLALLPWKALKLTQVQRGFLMYLFFLLNAKLSQYQRVVIGRSRQQYGVTWAAVLTQNVEANPYS